MGDGRRPMGGKVVVVTGGSAGVGRATAVAFATSVPTGNLARGRDRLEAARIQVEAHGVLCLALATDVGRPGRPSSCSHRRSSIGMAPNAGG